MLAQLMLLFPEWKATPVEGKVLSGRRLTDIILVIARTQRADFTIQPFKQQLAEIDVPEEWKAVLRLLLDPHRKKRSSASDLLQSPEYLAIR